MGGEACIPSPVVCLCFVRGSDVFLISITRLDFKWKTKIKIC